MLTALTQHLYILLVTCLYDFNSCYANFNSRMLMRFLTALTDASAKNVKSIGI